MKFSHIIEVRELGRLDIWDASNGLRCKVIRSGLIGDKSQIIDEKGHIMQIPTEWLIPLKVSHKCVCEIRVMMNNGCQCGGI